MNLFFNELSINPIAVDKHAAIRRMAIFSKAVSEARKKGFRNIKCDYFTNEILLAPDYTFYQWLNDSDVNREQREFLYGVIIPPYINDDDANIFEEYIETQFIYTNEENQFPLTNCIGFASAYLYDLPAISLKSLPIWDNIQQIITIRKGDDINLKIVYNISSVESFNEANLLTFIEQISELNLVETPINPNDKKVTLFGDHHGKKELKKLCDKLINNPYVIEIRSTVFGGNKFIKKITKDGILEIVLLNTDSRYAIWVQTTGKNLRETRVISDIIKNDYI